LQKATIERLTEGSKSVSNSAFYNHYLFNKYSNLNINKPSRKISPLIEVAFHKATSTNVKLADRSSTPGSQALPVLELALLAAYSPSTISSYSAALQHGSGGWSCGQTSNSFSNFYQ
jgi:hypothetical protein